MGSKEVPRYQTWIAYCPRDTSTINPNMQHMGGEKWRPRAK
jgi:hypothetical protein